MEVDIDIRSRNIKVKGIESRVKLQEECERRCSWKRTQPKESNNRRQSTGRKKKKEQKAKKKKKKDKMF